MTQLGFSYFIFAGDDTYVNYAYFSLIQLTKIFQQLDTDLWKSLHRTQLHAQRIPLL